MTSSKIPENVGDFRLMDRCVVEALKELPESRRFMKGLFAWVGFKTTHIDYARPQRCASTRKFNGWKLRNFALEGITSFSTDPLKIWTYLGLMLSAISFLLAIFIALKVIAHGILGTLFNGAAYITVNKVPDVSEIGLMYGESLRFTFTSTVFSVLLLPAIWQSLAHMPRLRFLALASILIHACAINIYAHEGKMKEVPFQRGLISALKGLAPLPYCAINIRSKGVGMLTNYEYGDIFYRGHGETNQLPLGDSKNPIFDMKELYEKLTKESYRRKYFMPAKVPNCIVYMNVTTSISKWNAGKTFAKYFSGKGDAIVTLSISKMSRP